MRKLIDRFWAWVIGKKTSSVGIEELKIEKTVLPTAMEKEEMEIDVKLTDYGAGGGGFGENHLHEVMKDEPKPPRVKQSLSAKYNPNVVRGLDGRYESKR